jgi:hypothetical protein
VLIRSVEQVVCNGYKESQNPKPHRDRYLTPQGSQGLVPKPLLLGVSKALKFESPIDHFYYRDGKKRCCLT